jgi:hypothetical protein
VNQSSGFVQVAVGKNFNGPSRIYNPTGFFPPDMISLTPTVLTLDNQNNIAYFSDNSAKVYSFSFGPAPIVTTGTTENNFITTGTTGTTGNSNTGLISSSSTGNSNTGSASLAESQRTKLRGVFFQIFLVVVAFTFFF